jgi:hypothetical protein
MWDAITGEQLLRLEDMTQLAPSTLSFSPDGRMLAAGGWDHHVCCREATSGQELLDCVVSGEVHSLVFAPGGQRLAVGTSDGRILILNVAPPVGPCQEDRLTAEGLNQLWDQLGDRDAARAYRAVRALVTIPGQALPLLKRRVQPAAREKMQRVRQLIADLDSDSYDIREAASKELTVLAPIAELMLRKTAAETTSAEVRSHAQAVLKPLGSGVLKDPDILRPSRAIWVLLRIATPEAQAVLKSLADGAPDVWQTQEAQAALEYLKKTQGR